MAEKTSTTRLRMYGGLVILLGILAVWLLYLYWPLMTGTTVLLAIHPLDPFDPLRGQYMHINYEISTLKHPFSEGETVYVSLAPDEEGIWRGQTVSKAHPGGVAIKGRVRGRSRRIAYGIEQFFFERNAHVPTRNISVEAKVSKGGRARIVHLLQNGKPVKIS